LLLFLVIVSFLFLLTVAAAAAAVPLTCTAPFPTNVKQLLIAASPPIDLFPITPATLLNLVASNSNGDGGLDDWWSSSRLLFPAVFSLRLLLWVPPLLLLLFLLQVMVLAMLRLLPSLMPSVSSEEEAEAGGNEGEGNGEVGGGGGGMSSMPMVRPITIPLKSEEWWGFTIVFRSMLMSMSTLSNERRSKSGEGQFIIREARTMTKMGENQKKKKEKKKMSRTSDGGSTRSISTWRKVAPPSPPPNPPDRPPPPPPLPFPPAMVDFALAAALPSTKPISSLVPFGW
jgi:hypothetical protein